MKIKFLIIISVTLLVSCFSKNEEITQNEKETQNLNADSTFTLTANQFAINGEIDSAAKYYLKAIDNNPRNLNARFGISNVYYLQGEYLKQKNELDIILATDTSFYDAYLYRGMALRELQDYDSAFLNFSKSIQVGIEVSECLMYIGQVYGELENNVNAIEYFTKAITYSNNSPKHYFERGYFYLVQGDTQKFCHDYTSSKNFGLLDSIAKGEYKSIQHEIEFYNKICNSN